MRPSFLAHGSRSLLALCNRLVGTLACALLTLHTPVAAAQDLTAAASASGPRSWSAGPFVASSIMHPLTFGIDFHESPSWSAAATYGNFTYAAPSSGKVDSLDVKISHFEAAASFFPWDGVFHVDAGLGRQTIAVDAVSNQQFNSGGTTGDKLKLSAAFDIVSSYFYAGCGWLWRWESGLMLGSGVGLQLPFASGSSFSARIEDSPILDEAIKSTTAYGDLDRAVHKAGKTAGMLAMPRIELIKAGWLF